MIRHVILLTDAHEPPAPTLLEALHETGLRVLVEGLRERLNADAATLAQESENGDEGGAPPLAVLYEVNPAADALEIHAAIEHARATWKNAPLVACRPRTNNRPEHFLQRPLDSSALKRMGFRSIADDAAQLPALLRELEERGTTAELPSPPTEIESELLPTALLLPDNLKVNSLRAAFELVASLHFTHDQKSAAHTALAGLSSLVEADRWAIYLTSEASAGDAVNLEPLAVRGMTLSEREAGEGELRRALLGDEVALSGAESKAAREAIASLEIVRKTERGRRFIALPLTSGEKLTGILEGVREGKRARAFTRRDTALLSALSLPLAFALGNSLRIAEAERLSLTDDLTKLHNARYLRQYLLSEIKRARRYGTSCAALFFDLDNFKLVNDLHGHLVGSHVLMEMATNILSSVRDTDVVARYGGDEFVVVLPESNIEQAAFVAGRVREKIERHIFTGGRGLRLQLTASFGVAGFPQHAQSPQQLIACADAAMYEAKAAGKNCVRFASSPPDVLQNEKVVS
ncbi:MAG TPA: sensor domain-containing diguanylate cyclase [Pyrinomonadaceae bacterium]|jgi:diguanylate cyclase (GGDEF)-like protein